MDKCPLGQAMPQAVDEPVRVLSCQPQDGPRCQPKHQVPACDLDLGRQPHANRNAAGLVTTKLDTHRGIGSEQRGQLVEHPHPLDSPRSAGFQRESDVTDELVQGQLKRPLLEREHSTSNFEWLYLQQCVQGIGAEFFGWPRKSPMQLDKPDAGAQPPLAQRNLNPCATQADRHVKA